jgi:ankyrin repeat protein
MSKTWHERINKQLVIACKEGDAREADQLIKNGADIEAKDCFGRTLLYTAVFNNNIKTVNLLLSHGANVNVKDKHQRTPLYWATYYGCIKIMKLLIDKGADVKDMELIKLIKMRNKIGFSKEVIELLKTVGAIS